VSETWGDGTGSAPVRRISDDERQRVVDRLRDAAGRGLLDLDELGDRIGAVYEAKTFGELDPITADLPAPAPPKDGPKVQHRRPLVLEDDEFRGHLTTYCLVIGMLVVLWMLSGFGHPWPIYPALGWGIGLGSHHQVASTHQRKRLARARSLGIGLDELSLREEEERGAKRAARQSQRNRHRPDQARRQLDQVARQAEQMAQQAARQAEQWARQVGPAGRPPRSAPPSTPPAPAPPSGGPTSRYVVAMFVDVVGSTGLNEALGDAGWMRVRERLRETLGECFTREGGWVVNTAGDGILARFDHPNSAVCAAVEIQRRLAQERHESGFAPSVRIGIHSGDAVEVGDDLIGGVVNLASRVTGAGEPDQITITEHVADHLDPSFDTEDRGIHSLKGVSRPRHLLTVRWH
jgi:class 3 adenylate cyclase